MYSKRLSASRNEIRLLTVVPAQPQASASAEQSDLVRCTLYTYSTDKRHKKVSLKLFLPEENEDSPIENKEGPSSTKDSRIRQPPEAGQHRFSWGDYACLSYTWGDPTDTTDIVVNGDTIAVSSNLESALRTLRNRGEFPGHFKLWFDAICINQENAEERSQQVQKMEDIYDGAWNVVVWLGAEADGSEKAFTLLRTLSNLTPGELNELPQDLSRNPAHLGVGGWAALHQLLYRSYWRRAWIVQELAMGQPDMPVICGNSEIDWESLCKGLLFMDANKGDLLDILIKRDRENAGLEQDPPSWDLMASFAESLYAFVEIIHQQEDMPSFAHILAVSRQAQATDLRDKVYSMLGFMSSTVRNELRVDYTLTAREVYITAMKAFLWGNDVIGMSGLDLLRELDHVDTIEGVQTPSWVVDWSISTPFNAELRLKYSAGSWHHTNKSLLVDNLKFSVDRGVMSCQVTKLDYVDGLGAKSNHEQYPDRKMTPDTIVQPVKTQNTYDSPEEAKIALWRALLGDQTEFTKTTFAGSRSRYYVQEAMVELLKFGPCKADLLHEGLLEPEDDQFYHPWKDWYEANAHFNIAGIPLRNYTPDVDTNKKAFKSAIQAMRGLRAFSKRAQNFRFMTTRKGYLGWAPDSANTRKMKEAIPGDLICILLGCSVPMVVRPKGEQYEIIRECYVQGFMHGEALKNTDALGLKIERMSFC